ncbi:hypothetical protein RCL1_008928 [Eukaryota sp. TZLM3-RCL]
MDCCICLQGFDSSTRVPYIICCNNHSVCKSCYPQLRSCPFCRSNVLQNPQPNRDLAHIVSAVLKGDFIESIPPSELESPLNDRIGSGGFGSVYANSWMGADVAVKVVDLSEDGKRRLRREVAFISRLNHPSVIRVFGICEFADKIGIVMERGDGCLPIPSLLSRATLKYAIDIVNAVKFLHSKQVVHGDLKPENILLIDNKIKLTDFGTARTIATSSLNPTVFAATPKYAPLESFDGKCYPQSDVYSIGIILYEILCNKIAFEGDSVINIMGKKYTNYVPPFDDSDHPELKRIITECCNRDENSRPTLDAISSVLKSLLTGLNNGNQSCNARNQVNSEIDVIETSIGRLDVNQNQQRLASRPLINNRNDVGPQDNLVAQDQVISPRELSKRAKEHYNRGEDLQKQKNFNEALDAYDAAIRVDPNYVYAHYNRGLVLKQLQRYDEALQAYDAAIRVDPNYVHAHNNRGDVLAKLNRPNDALESYDNALRVDSRNVYAHNGRGLVLENLQRFNEALEAYDAAIRVDPNYVHAHTGRGVVLENLQRFNEALEAYDAAIRVDPNYAIAHYNRGLVLKHLQRFDEALEAYDAAIRVDPNYVHAHNNRGDVLAKLNRPNDALESYDNALRVDSRNVYAHTGRGIVLENLQRFNEALEAYDAAIRVDPNYVHAHTGRGVVLENLQRFNEALEAYDAAIRVDPNYVHAHHGRGVVLENLQRFNEALEAYDAAIRVDPNYAIAHYNRGLVLKHLQRFDEALEAYDAAIRVDPNYVYSHNNRGVVLKQLQRFDEALEAYDAAIRVDPNYVRAFNNRAKLLKKMNRL